VKTHRHVTPRQEALAESNLYGAIAALRSPGECRAFLRDLCTPAEIQAMADRWTVVDFLRRGLPYRQIHRLSGVSVTTIGRVARFLAAGNGGYAVAASRINRRQRVRAVSSRVRKTEITLEQAPGESDGSRHG
jgi:TrpR-related protein YerC/YecD